MSSFWIGVICGAFLSPITILFLIGLGALLWRKDNATRKY